MLHLNIMLPEYFAIVSALINAAGGFYYFYQTVIGKAKPNRVSWLLWGLFPMIAFVAQRAQNVDLLSWISFSAGFMPLLIVAVSFFNKKAYWKTHRRDYFLMAMAIGAFILWGLTNNPNLAIVLSIIADFLAGLPTIIKAYKHPETESSAAFAIGTFGFAIGLLSIHTFTFQSYAFVVYLFLMNLLITLLASRKALH